MLIEVMVAGMLLVIASAGLGAAQLSALAASHESDVTSRLVALHATLADRLRLHPASARAGLLNIDLPAVTSPDEVPRLHPLLEDISTALHQSGSRGYLIVNCTGESCRICVGLFGKRDNADAERSGPAARLCSNQRPA